MKRFPPKTFTCGSINLWWIPLFFAAARLAVAAPLQEARVSQVIEDVRLLEAHAAPRPAAVNDKVTLQRAVRTGKESRAELTFTDLTITRLGANTIFSLKAGAREVDLTSGTILLAVPSGAAPAKANTVSVTVSVMGGTALLATGPPTKFMVLEGIGTIYPKGHPEKAVTVHGGEMVIAENGRISNPEKFDVKLVLETSPLIVDFPPLTNLPLILAVMNQQLAEQQLAGITSQPLARNLIDLIDVTDQNANANPILVAVRSTTPTPSPTISPTITPAPTPSKFGTPSTIASPNPYLITSGTTITTDPSIITNGVTDFGKIYRGSTDDGPFTLWAFGSTSAFDTALNLDADFFADPSHLPIAVFKFQNLSLNGNPTIDTSNGGVTKLALIGVDGITSGPPGGVLTFTGLDLLALATVNGSINLTSDVSFQNLSELAMYARGAGSNLTIDSPISNIGILELAAEGSIQLTNSGTMSVGEFHATAGDDLALQIGGSLLLNGSVRLDTLVLPGTTVASGADLTVNITGDYTNSSATEFSLSQVTNQGHIGTGGNISVDITGNLTATGPGGGTDEFEPGDFAVVVQNTNAQIDNGGNLNLTVNGNVQVNGLAAYLQNYDETANPAGHIGTGGNIDIEIGGNLTANSYVDVVLNNRGGGRIDSGGNLTFNIGGALTIGDADSDGFSAEFIVSTRYDDIMGNTTPSFIGSDVSLFLHASSVDMAGDLDGFFISNRGSTIDGSATATWDVPGTVTIQGDASWFLFNDGGPVAVTPFGGTIHGDALLQITAGSLNADVPTIQINNQDGGVIDLNATVTLNISGDMTSTSDSFVKISNQRRDSYSGPSGGLIGGDAMVNVTASNFSGGGIFDVEINNRNTGIGSGTGGSIGGNAAINLNLADTVSSGSAVFFQILNNSIVAGSPGGSIGGAATVDVNAGNLTSGADVNSNALIAQIDNRGGTIGGNATIDFAASGNVDAQGNALFQIFNFDDGVSGGGTIGSDATSNVTAANISTGGSLFDTILNNGGGNIGGIADLSFALTGDLATQGDALFVIDNFDGGTIGTGAAINVTAANISAGGSLFANFNNPGGSIVGNANLNFTLTGDLTTQGDANFAILNEDEGSGGGTIGFDAMITVNAANISTGGSLFATIFNTGGNIGGNANLNFSLTGDLTPQGDASFVIDNNNFGLIGSDATINVVASSISVGGGLDSDIFNPDGSIVGIANINFNLTGNLSTQGTADFLILNNTGGTIGADATINVTAGNITANSLVAQIDNTGGSIGANTEGGAMINMNVSNSATVTNDATVAIYGSDGAVGGAGININGGSYDAGGTFLAFIDQDGTITFNNATAHADVLKVGALGTNGVLNIGGSMLSADTTLELYASGSNGQLNFMSNVTLGGNSIKILAANSVTIFDNIVVTIGGPNPAEVYTNNANYTGFGGNGTTTGTFAGAGANNPLPLDQAPPFGPAPRTARPRDGTINVRSTAELLALLDGAVVGPDGRITISDSKSASWRDLNRMNIDRLSRLEHKLAIQRMRDRGITRVGGGRLAAAQ